MRVVTSSKPAAQLEIARETLVRSDVRLTATPPSTNVMPKARLIAMGSPTAIAEDSTPITRDTTHHAEVRGHCREVA